MPSVGRVTCSRGRGARQDQRLVGHLGGGDPDLLARTAGNARLRRSARVRMAAVLRPASGSVTAKQALCSPRMSGGSMRFFCSSLPNTTTGLSPKMFMCTAEAPLMQAPDCGDRAHQHRGLRDAEAGAAIGLRHGDAEQARLGDRAVEVFREFGAPVLLQPIGIVEAGGEPLGERHAPRAGCGVSEKSMGSTSWAAKASTRAGRANGLNRSLPHGAQLPKLLQRKRTESL